MESDEGFERLNDPEAEIVDVSSVSPEWVAAYINKLRQELAQAGVLLERLLHSAKAIVTNLLLADETRALLGKEGE